MSRAAAALAGSVLTMLVVGCTTQVSGQGRPEAAFPSTGVPPSTFAGPSTSPPSSAPSSSGPSSSTTPAALRCPHVVDVVARLAYDCIVDAMTVSTTAAAGWSVSVTKSVDVDWVLAEQSVPLDPSVDAATLPSVVDAVTQDLLVGDYGDNPRAVVVSSAPTTVDGHASQLQQTLITLDPSYAAANHLKVKTERLWVLVVQVDAAHRSVLTISVPDAVQTLWPLVPALLTTVHVR